MKIRSKICSLIMVLGLFVSGMTITFAQEEPTPEIIINQTEETNNEEETNSEEELIEDVVEENQDTTVPSQPTNEEMQTPVVPANDALETQNVQPLADEGFTFDEATGTLTITASTGDYTSSTVSSAPYYQYKSDITKIVVDGDENTVIGSYAFRGYTSLESVEIKKCGNIGDRAFGGCSKLTSLTIGECGNFDVYVFQNDSKLSTVTIGTCGDIGEDAFNGASGLTTFTVTGSCGNIADYTFSGKTSLTTVSINQAGNIGKNAFDGCSSLSSLTLNTAGDLGNKAFFDCPALETIEITKCGNIGQGAFGKTGKSIKITECGDIGGYAFVDNSNQFAGGPLESIEIGKCGSIGGSAFTYLKNLTDVKIGTCTEIKGQAFAFASGLKNVTIENCTLIGDTAFMSAGAPIEELVLKNCAIDGSAFYMVKINDLYLENISQIGDAAFQSSTIKNITLSGIDELGDGSFAGVKGLETLTIKDLDEISEDAFEMYDTTVNKVKTINLENVRYIGAYAFKGFPELTTVNVDENCEYIGAHAFTGCDKLETINLSDKTKLGYSDSFVNQDYVHNRVQAILDGTFNLMDTSTPIETVSPEGWTSVQVGEENSTEKVGDTQITKEAKWANDDATVADVLLKAYYSANQQMDFVFVADCSNSMSGFGSSDAMNSNFYNMQSKMMDVANQLLNSKDLDTRVAFSTFGENESSVSSFFEKGQAAQAKDYIWNDIVNYESNTNYSVGLQGALQLVQENKAAGRNTTVIFISDGQPFYPGEVPGEYYGKAQADAIRAEGALMISVLQQVSPDSLASSQANMEQISDKVYASTDLAGFSTAVNDAIDYAYTSYTITDVIDPGFVLDEASITASEGTTYTVGTNAEGNQVITWTISNQPFKLVNLQYQLNLIPNQNGTYPIGQFDTNEGYATMTTGSTQVNQVQTPVLPRDGVKVTVDKKWEKDNESVRPDSIEVNLLKDGEVFDTVTIAKEDNWTYTWSDLDFINNWTVEEIAVADYNGKVDDKSQDALNKEYVITNTYTKEITPEKDPGQEDKPKEDEKSEGTKTAAQTYIGLFSALASISLILVLLMAVLKKKMA